MVEPARSVRKDQGRNILQCEMQTLLINSLLCATVNIYRESTENVLTLSPKVFRRNVLQA